MLPSGDGRSITLSSAGESTAEGRSREGVLRPCAPRHAKRVSHARFVGTDKVTSLTSASATPVLCYKRSRSGSAEAAVEAQGEASSLIRRDKLTSSNYSVLSMVCLVKSGAKAGTVLSVVSGIRRSRRLRGSARC
ncbi:protein of unknown function (plasmid) [Pararobbsia alpina]